MDNLKNAGATGSFSFTPQQLNSVLRSKEGQALLQLLNRDGGAALRQAASAVQSGDYEAAKKIMEPVMQTPEAAELVDRINRK